MERDTYCQPLPGGGALLIVFFPRWQQRRAHPGHKDDQIGQVTRFRDGRLTDLGQVFLPEERR